MADVFDIKFNTQFDKAREAANRRGVVLPSVYYGELPKQMRSLSNTISYIQSVETIQLILDDLKKAIDSGESFEKWRKRFNPEQFGITRAHAETVYRNALQTQYSVGRWEQIQQAKKNRPYLRYVAINDSRTSQCCRALSGIIRKVDDPFWNTHTPPNHHRCRSVVVSLTEKEAQKRSPPMVGLNQPESPEMQPQKGWDYNPALSHQNQMRSLLDEKIEKLPNASNWFKQTLREQHAKKLEGLLGVVESQAEKQIAEKTTMPKTKEYETAQTLLNELITKAENVTPTESKLKQLWFNPEKYNPHIEKRVELGHIASKADYEAKTFDVLANAKNFKVSIPPEKGMTAGKFQLVADGWVVLVAGDGKIITSYEYMKDKPTFEKNETDKGNKVYEHTISTEDRKILKRVFNLS